VAVICFVVAGVVYAISWAWEIIGDWLTVLLLKGD